MDLVNLSYYFWDEFVCLVDLLNISSFQMSSPTHGLVHLVVKPVHFYGPRNFLIILLDELVLLQICEFNVLLNLSTLWT